MRQNPFDIERKRADLAAKNKLQLLSKTYLKGLPEIRDLNTSTLWDDKNSHFNKFPMETSRIQLVSQMIRGTRIKVLNIGFGSLNLETFYFKSNNNDIEWFGTDISKASIILGRKKFDKANFKLGNILNLKYDNGFFDYVIALEVLEHIPPSDTFKALSEVYRVLKHKGKIIISVPLNEGLENMILKGENPNAHVRIYTPELIKAELYIAGFEIRQVIFLYAFDNLYRIKSFLAKYIFKKKYQPNNIIILAQKK